MKKIVVAFLVLLTVNQATGQTKKVSLFAEFGPALNFNAVDLNGDKEIIKVKGLISYGGGLGVVFRPKVGRFMLKLSPGFWNNPQVMEIRFRDIGSGETKILSYKRNETFFSFKVSPSLVFPQKNGSLLGFGPVVYINTYLSSNFEPGTKKYYTTYHNPQTGFDQTELNAAVDVYTGVHENVSGISQKQAIVGLSGQYSFGKKLGKSSCWIGIELVRLLGEGSENSNSMAYVTTFDRVGLNRVVTGKSTYNDRHLMCNFVFGISLF